MSLIDGWNAIEAVDGLEHLHANAAERSEELSSVERGRGVDDHEPGPPLWSLDRAVVRLLLSGASRRPGRAMKSWLLAEVHPGDHNLGPSQEALSGGNPKKGQAIYGIQYGSTGL